MLIIFKLQVFCHTQSVRPYLFPEGRCTVIINKFVGLIRDCDEPFAGVISRRSTYAVAGFICSIQFFIQIRYDLAVSRCKKMIFFSILGLLTSITFFVIIQRDSLIVSSWLGVAFKTRPSVDANNLAIILLKITGYDDIITSYEVEIELIGAILSLALFSLIKPLYQRWKIVIPNWDKMIFLILSCLVSGLLGKF